LKGVGEGPVEALLEARNEGGNFQDIFDLAKRANLRAVNKRCFESLVHGGAFDSWENVDRAQYFTPTGDYETLIEAAIKFGNTYQNQQAQMQVSLFGGTDEDFLVQPKVPACQPWSTIEKLEKEKEVTGIYISGHPLDDYELEIVNFTNCPLSKAEDIVDRNLKLAGLVTEVFHGTTQKGTGYGRFTIQDYTGSLQIALFNEQYENWKNIIFKGNVLYVEGMNAKRYNQERYYFRVKDIKMLDSIGKELTRSITLKIDLDHLNKEMVNKLETICQENSGPHLFKMRVVDQENETELDLISKNVRVNATNQFVKVMEEMGFPYKLN
jgi:DNA polymerase-3 subunit alpha